MLEKTNVVRCKQIEHTLSEKQILASVDCPFVVKLVASFKDAANLFMVLEYVPGGELFFHLRASKYFAEPTIRFYAIEIGLAIEYLHHNHIMYRDLKPENVLIDATGHIKLTDFGFAKRVERTTWTICGTPEYMAPEIIIGKGYTKAVDWWALGVLLYEMSTGHPPFEGANEMAIYRSVLSAKLTRVEHVSDALFDLTSNLLHIDLTRRLGNMYNGINDIKQHPWFGGNGWQLNMMPPIVPDIKHAEDTSNFEDFPNEAIKTSQHNEYVSSTEMLLFYPHLSTFFVSFGELVQFKVLLELISITYVWAQARRGIRGLLNLDFS